MVLWNLKHGFSFIGKLYFKLRFCLKKQGESLFFCFFIFVVFVAVLANKNRLFSQLNLFGRPLFNYSNHQNYSESQMFRYNFLFQIMKSHIHYSARMIQFMDITHLKGNSAIKICSKSIILGREQSHKNCLRPSEQNKKSYHTTAVKSSFIMQLGVYFLHFFWLWRCAESYFFLAVHFNFYEPIFINSAHLIPNLSEHLCSEWSVKCQKNL